MAAPTSVHAEGDDVAALACLDVLQGASALMTRHKAQVMRLLPERGPTTKAALEQLVADVMEILRGHDATTTAVGEGQQPRQRRGGDERAREDGAARPASPIPQGGVKRAKGQQAEQDMSMMQGHRRHQQQQAGPVSSSSPVNCDPLGVPEVLEHVMSFIRYRERLGRLSRVCRLWRHVSEAEALCLPVVRREMPSALLGGEESLHARLGGSARRCLLVLNGWLRPGRLLCDEPSLEDLRLMVEVRHYGRVLYAAAGWTRVSDSYPLTIELDEVSGERNEGFTAASLGVDTVHDAFMSEALEVRFSVLDPSTGVTACIVHGRFHPEGPVTPHMFLDCLSFTSLPMPLTSLTYAGPPLEAEVNLGIGSHVEDGEADFDTIVYDRQRRWKMDDLPQLRLKGPPGVHGEKFIRTRLAEELATARQTGRRWW